MVTKEEYSQLTAAELKAGLAEYRKTNIPAPGGFERLPATIVPKGFVSAVSTAEFLKHVSRHDLRTFQYYCRRYGVDQINSYLGSV